MTLWGGRFSEPPDESLWRFTVDAADQRMLLSDIRGSVAHVTMLGEAGILEADEAETIRDGLGAILDEAQRGAFQFLPQDEDLHSAVERRLGEIIGALAGKLHTGRSRNDQVALDLRLHLAESAEARARELEAFAGVLAAQARTTLDAEIIVPSYTHVQQAQAVPLAHHLLAYAWMLLRDAERFRDARVRIHVSPLGAGAAGGSSLPLNPERSAELLGMPATFENSLDAVASRDFVAEYGFCCAQAMVHLSRLSEELVLWAGEEFGWARFADRYTTGSSALPQKKNPDIAELVRGRSARAIGNLTALMTLQKALPLAYNRDLQEDKPLVFDADDTLRDALAALTGMVATATFDPPPPSPWVTALDLAEALVGRGVPFREAHGAVGRLVAALIQVGRNLDEATVDDLAKADPRFEAADLARTSPRASVEARVTRGGGGFEAVRVQLGRLEGRLGIA